MNAAAEYWSGIVGVPFARDINLHVADTPLDLDLDGDIDTTFSAQWNLKGGLLANPHVAGFIPTPNDPKGTVGEYSISTGFLGVREEMDPNSRKGTGRFGFNCWYCHATADGNGDVLWGRPNTKINLGLILAASQILDERHVIKRQSSAAPISESALCEAESLDDSFHLDLNNDRAVSIAEWRHALKLPPAAKVQAMMLLAGPGRLDQSVDPRMDGFVPLANLQHYWFKKSGPQHYLESAHRPKLSSFNPVSIPAALSGLGVGALFLVRQRLVNESRPGPGNFNAGTY
ncbi:MAG: hypothetical protein IPK83_05980 [Planctomycetes bacterium]|nr:hypothetical protein [Planctomycetota bacterium]